MQLARTAFRLLSGVVAITAAGGAGAQVSDAARPAMLFFDWGKAELSRDATGTLDAMVPDLLKSPGATVTLESHSDRSGPIAANRYSSQRRAEVVRDYLIGRGVAAGAITIQAFGEDRPIITTADGVREPQNRRVDVRVMVARP